MPYGGILPYAIHDHHVMLLLGKEKPQAGWSGSERWSPFGGSVDDGETLEQAALREGYEESMGVLGTASSMRGKGRAWYHRGGLTLLLPLKYDRHLPRYFRRFYQYAQRARRAACSHGWREGWYEKTHIKWVRLSDVAQLDLRPEFRRSLRALRRTLRDVVPPARQQQPEEEDGG